MALVDSNLNEEEVLVEQKPAVSNGVIFSKISRLKDTSIHIEKADQYRSNPEVGNQYKDQNRRKFGKKNDREIAIKTQAIKSRKQKASDRFKGGHSKHILRDPEDKRTSLKKITSAAYKHNSKKRNDVKKSVDNRNHNALQNSK
jgi:hypothetical protein